MNWKSFGLGFLLGVALLSAISHWRMRPQNVIATWTDENSKTAMKMIAPWITEARVGKLGPFLVMVPKSFDNNPEAFLRPTKANHPWVYVTEKEIMIYDKKKSAISVDYDASTGQLSSYSYFPDLTTGTSYTDRRMTGLMEKVELPAKKK